MEDGATAPVGPGAEAEVDAVLMELLGGGEKAEGRTFSGGKGLVRRSQRVIGPRPDDSSQLLRSLHYFIDCSFCDLADLRWEP
ncbi:hypothetical protein GCM10009626_29890 [Brachybacterium sacelli]